MGVAGPIFELHPSYFVRIHMFLSCKDASIFVAISDNLKPIDWNSCIGLLKAIRSLEYSKDLSYAPKAVPIDRAPIDIRPEASVFINALNQLPGVHNIELDGILMSLK